MGDIIPVVIERNMQLNALVADQDVIFHTPIETLTELNRTSEAEIVIDVIVG